MSQPRKRALITGAAKRIGAAIAHRLAHQGYDLLLHANRSVETLAQMAKNLRKIGVEVTCEACDFTDRAATQVFADQIFASQRIDLLVNNASLFQNDRLPAIDDELFEAHMNVNFHAPRILMTAIYQTAQASGREGHIINLLDHKLRILNPDFFSYTTSKAALGTMTKTCAMQFAPHVRVNSISPGIALISGKQSQQDFEASWASAPMGRSATPEQIADTVLYFERATAIHGEDIVIDGGQSLYHLPRDIAFLSKHGAAPQDKGDS